MESSGTYLGNRGGNAHDGLAAMESFSDVDERLRCWTTRTEQLVDSLKDQNMEATESFEKQLEQMSENLKQHQALMAEMVCSRLDRWIAGHEIRASRTSLSHQVSPTKDQPLQAIETRRLSFNSAADELSPEASRDLSITRSSLANHCVKPPLHGPHPLPTEMMAGSVTEPRRGPCGPDLDAEAWPSSNAVESDKYSAPATHKAALPPSSSTPCKLPSPGRKFPETGPDKDQNPKSHSMSPGIRKSHSTMSGLCGALRNSATHVATRVLHAFNASATCDKIEPFDKAQCAIAGKGTYARYLSRATSGKAGPSTSQSSLSRTATMVDKVLGQGASQTRLEQWFDAFFAVVLLSNIIVIGVEVNHMSEYPEETTPVWFTVIDCVYCILFVLELVCRVAFGGLRIFWRKEDCHWNIFDMIMVACTIADTVVSLVDGGNQNRIKSNLHIVRFVRVARVTRVVRVFRVLRFFRRLRVLVVAICATLKSCAAAVMLLCMFMYIFAIVFTQAYAHKVRLTFDFNDEFPAVRNFFGSLPRAFYTLFMSIMGGIDWQDASLALSDIHWFLLGLFIVYVTLVLLIVMNVVTSIFVQCAIESAETDRAEAMVALTNDVDKHIRILEQLFNEWDTAQTGSISAAEFEEHIGDDRMCMFFKTLQIEVPDAKEFFKLLDRDCGGSVDIREFVEGCLELRGNARSMQVGQLMRENRLIMAKLLTLEDLLHVQPGLHITRADATPSLRESAAAPIESTNIFEERRKSRVVDELPVLRQHRSVTPFKGHAPLSSLVNEREASEWRRPCSRVANGNGPPHMTLP